MSEQQTGASCLACDLDSEATPLIPLEYQGSRIWICPRHLPLLIHEPQELIGKLAGAEKLKPSDHHD